MSLFRQQALIDAPADQVWELLGDPARHPEWWPRVVEVRCEWLEQGCSYRQVIKSPIGAVEREMSVERLDDCQELLVRCLDTGTYHRWLMTPAQGGTFVDVEFGMDPKTIGHRVFDAVAGRRYFRRWLELSVGGLERAVGRPDSKAA